VNRKSGKLAFDADEEGMAQRVLEVAVPSIAAELPLLADVEAEQLAEIVDVVLREVAKYGLVAWCRGYEVHRAEAHSSRATSLPMSACAATRAASAAVPSLR
jgi:hypothetical protein